MFLILTLALAVDLSLWAQSGDGASAVAHLGQCDPRSAPDRSSRRLLLVRSELRKVQRTCGSLGAVIGFMTWPWISAIVTLLGAEIDAEMEHQTTRDTTSGASKPLGTRGARVADTVGSAQG